ncbi:MAG: hypothetical protein AAGI52_12300 [Bacteroidota bacterium]
MRLALVLVCLLPLSALAQKKPPPGPSRDARVEGTLNALGYEYEIDEDGDYKLIFETDNGRSHIVWVRPTTDRLLDLEVREVFAIANNYIGGVPGGIPPRLLEDNAQFILGSWAIEATTILFVVKIRANATRAEMEAALLATASTADAMEEELTGGTDDW